MSFDQTLMRINSSRTNEMLSVHSIVIGFLCHFCTTSLMIKVLFLLNAAKSEITFGKVSIFPRMFWNLTFLALNKES